MLRIETRIKMNNVDNEVSGFDIDQKLGINNVSTILPPINKKSKGNSAWVIGYSKIGDPHTLENKVENGGTIDYYMSSVKTSVNGKYENTVAALFDIKVLKETNTITIYFDTHRGIFPKNIQFKAFSALGERENFSLLPDDPIVTIQTKKPFVSLSILILGYNGKDVPIIIEGILCESEIIISPRDLISIELKKKDRANEQLPSFGIYSNRGSLSFIDSNKEISDYIEQGMLDTHKKIEFYFENTEVGKKSYIDTYLTDNWEYDPNNRVVNVSLVDDLITLQGNKFYLFDLGYRQEIGYSNYSASELYKILKDKIQEKGFIIKENNVAISRINFRDFSKIYEPKQMTLWQYLDAFCKALGLNVFKGTDKEIFINGDAENIE